MIDFIDLGCGAGGSILWAENRFGGKSHLGIDNNAIELNKAVGINLNVVLGDVTRDDFVMPKSRYITMIHFLEHLKNEETIEYVIKKSIESASDFIFMKVPHFDSDEYLKSLNLKLTWSDWTCHPTRVTKAMFEKISDKFGLEYKTGYLYPIINSNSHEIIPFSSHGDVVKYSDLLGEKKYVEFTDVYRETYCFININCSNWDQIINKNIL